MLLLDICNPYLAPRIIIQNKTLLIQMVRRSISARYKGTALGLIWSFAQPLMMLAVYTFVFGFIFKVRWGIEQSGISDIPFPLIMFCGMATFNIFSESANISSGIVTANANYVKKVVFPLEILPFSVVITTLVFSLTWFVLLFLGILLYAQQLQWTMLLLPITLFPLILFSCGISFFTASLGVYIRDTQHIIGIITQILFFMTPIFYPISVVPETMRWILEYNPISTFVEETRKVYLFGSMPDWTTYGICFVVSCLVFQLGLVWFSKTKKGFADVL